VAYVVFEAGGHWENKKWLAWPSTPVDYKYLTILK
jgi:hypothetical protein